MYKKELELHIKNNTLAKSYLFYGACEYQINLYADKILSLWAQGDEINKFYFDEYDFSAVKASLSQSSLFGDKNLVRIKTDKAIPKKELDVLVGICAKNENAFLALECYNEEKAKNMAKSFSKKLKADFVRFFKANMGEAMSYLAQSAKQIELNIQPYALSHLYATHNEDLSLSMAELEKLSILDREVNKSDVDSLIFGMGEVNMEEFISNIIDKKDVKKDFDMLSQSGQFDEIFLINSLEKYISQLFLFHVYIKLNGNLDVRAILGYSLPPQLAQKRSRQSMNLDINVFSDLLKCLIETEYAIKSTSFKDKSTYLLSAILKLQSLL